MSAMFGRFSSLIANLLLILATLLVFSGCPTPPKATPQLTALEPVPASVPREASIETVVVSPRNEPSAALKDRADAVLPEEKLQLPTGKLPLSSWAQLCGFTEMRSVPTANPPMIELISPGGNLTLFLGQRFAKWNGITVGLGFPPMAERGQVVVHSIDVFKNFYPLGLGTFSLPRPPRVLVI